MRCPTSIDEFTQLKDKLGLSLPLSNDVSLLSDAIRIGSRQTPNRFVALPMGNTSAN